MCSVEACAYQARRCPMASFCRLSVHSLAESVLSICIESAVVVQMGPGRAVPWARALTVAVHEPISHKRLCCVSFRGYVLWVAGFRVEWWPAGALSVSWCAYLGRRADGYTLVEACTGQTRRCPPGLCWLRFVWHMCDFCTTFLRCARVTVTFVRML